MQIPSTNDAYDYPASVTDAKRYAPPVKAADFGTPIHAVKDLGLDPSGQTDCSPKLERAVNATGRTLVEFPPGKYRINTPVDCTADWVGIRSTTGNPDDVHFLPPDTGFTHLLHGDHSIRPGKLLVENVTINRTSDWKRSMGLATGNWSDTVYIRNIRVPGSSARGEQLLIWNVERGYVLVDGIRKLGPTEFTEYPQGELTIYMGPLTAATVTYRNLEMANTRESAIYCGKDAGKVHVEDSYFENCMHTAVRVTGSESSVRNCSIRLDLSNQHPDNRNRIDQFTRRPDFNQPQVSRGIWALSDVHVKHGPLIEGCDIYLARDDGFGSGDDAAMSGSSPRTHAKIAGIHINADTGGATIRDCRIRNDNPDAWGILAKRPNDKAAAPTAIRIRDCHVRNSGSQRPCVDVQGRPNTALVDSHLAHDRSRLPAILFRDAPGSEVRRCEVSGGRARISLDADGGLSNIGTAPKPTEPNLGSWATAPDPAPGGPGETPAPNPTVPMPELPYIVRIEQTTGQSTRNSYTIEVDGELAAGPNATPPHEIPSAGRVTGGVGPLRGTDDYLFSGRITRFDISNPENARCTLHNADSSLIAVFDPGDVAKYGSIDPADYPRADEPPEEPTPPPDEPNPPEEPAPPGGTFEFTGPLRVSVDGVPAHVLAYRILRHGATLDLEAGAAVSIEPGAGASASSTGSDGGGESGEGS